VNYRSRIILVTQPTVSNDTQYNDFRPVESGAGKALSWGPITVSVLRRDQGAKCAEREETWGGMAPHHPTRGLGECCKLLQWGPGQSLGWKWILCIFEARKKPSGTPFTVFLSDDRASQMSRGSGKVPPSPLPSWRAWMTMIEHKREQTDETTKTIIHTRKALTL